ncbi:MAG: alpha/beta hydrolase [Solirubrobacteraceae bacterium]
MTELHPQVRPIVSGSTEPADLTGLEAQRAAYLQTALELGGAVEEVTRVEDVVLPRAEDDGRVAARAYWPTVPAEPLGAIVWFHGGGWCVGDLDGFDRVARQIANASGAVCLSVDYRLAPEHPHPAAVQDARAAVVWAAGHGAGQLGVDPRRLVVGGDSAGGNLAAVAARHHRELLRAQILLYPATDARMAGESYREHAEFGALPADAMGFCWKTYLDGADGDDPDVSPLRAVDLAGLPPALVVVAGFDVLRDDGVAYAGALRDAGVDVRLDRYEDMPHGFVRWGGIVDRGGELVKSLSAFARAALER